MAESHTINKGDVINVRRLCEELSEYESTRAITIEEPNPLFGSLVVTVYGPRKGEIELECDHIEIGGKEYSIQFELSAWSLDTLGKVVVYSELEPVDTNEGIKRLLESAEDSSEGDIHD